MPRASPMTLTTVDLGLIYAITVFVRSERH